MRRRQKGRGAAVGNLIYRSMRGFSRAWNKAGWECEGGLSSTWRYLLMVLYEELASLELLGVHHIQQLPTSSIGGLQVLPVELLQIDSQSRQTHAASTRT